MSGSYLAINPFLGQKCNNVGILPLSLIKDMNFRDQVEGFVFQGKRLNPMCLPTVPLSSSEQIITSIEESKVFDPHNPMYLPVGTPTRL